MLDPGRIEIGVAYSEADQVAEIKISQAGVIELEIIAGADHQGIIVDIDITERR